MSPSSWRLKLLAVLLFFNCGQIQAQKASQQPLTTPTDGVKQVAIIGAGAGGASTAYHLRKLSDSTNSPINITVFESSSHVGGRSTTVNAYDDPTHPVELGASIFVEINTILLNAANEFGLETVDTGSEADNTEMLGIWNGDEFVFTQKDSGWYWWDITKLLWKYGLAPIRTQRLMKSTVGNFRKMYEAPFFPFRSLSDRSIDLGLTAVTSMTGKAYLEANGITGPFTTDIIQASTRVNYGQNLGLIHGLETMVCMAIDGAMQIKGGNWQIFAGMLNSSSATLHLNTTVTAISKESDNKYSIKSSATDSISGKSITKNDKFDTVVLAAPLQYSNLDISSLVSHVPDKIPYVSLHVTLFTSPHKLNGSFFKIAPGDPVPDTILTTLSSDEIDNVENGVGKAGFFSISTLRSVVNPKTVEKEYLYKIFSPKAVDSEFLSGILGVDVPTDISALKPNPTKDITWYYPYVWNSYPYEYPRVTFEDIELARNFYYTSGIESFISTMETSSLMGMNVARLVVDDYLEVIKKEEIVTEKVVLGAEQILRMQGEL